jgi:hypothetical protein
MKKIFCFTLLLSLQSVAGGWSGNGGTSAYDKDNIWFLGDEPIPYCLITSENVPMKPAVEQMIRRNSGKWREFLARYGLDQDYFGKSYRPFPDKKERRISGQFVPAVNCGEVEQFCAPQKTNDEACYNALRDKVLFLVGTPNKVVSDYLRLNGAVQGAAIRTEYNHATYRTGGIVWINDLGTSGGWTQYEHLLLHEMGHVLGMKHNSCWVMSENVAALLKWNGIGDLGTIEGSNWPYSFKANDLLWFTDANLAFNGSPKGYYPNSFIHPALDALGFGKDNYFRVTGKIILVLNDVKIDIQIDEQPTGLTHHLVGNLGSHFSMNADINTPQIFTEWSSQQGPSKYFQTEYLRSGWVPEDLEGVFDWKGQKVPVILRRKKGMTLKMYFPGTSDWVTLQTVNYIP